ncbi:hypothetical protein KR200_006084 [Drosophila serrata]|nr:hypothetical protein KR200_006084 [Drosophila serrata]
MDYKRLYFLFSLVLALILCNQVGAEDQESEVKVEVKAEPEVPQLLEAGETAQNESGDESVRKVRQFYAPPPFGPPPPPFFGPPPPPYYGGGFYGGGGFGRTRVITRTRYRGRGGYYGGGFYG